MEETILAGDLLKWEIEGFWHKVEDVDGDGKVHLNVLGTPIDYDMKSLLELMEDGSVTLKRGA